MIKALALHYFPRSSGVAITPRGRLHPDADEDVDEDADEHVD